MHSDIHKLAIASALALGFPVIVFASGRIWFRMVGGSTPRVDKLWATACLLLPIISLGMAIQVGFESIRVVWQEHPMCATIAYFFLGAVIPAILIYTIVCLWRGKFGGRHEIADKD
jgi:hypothetical protein